MSAFIRGHLSIWTQWRRRAQTPRRTAKILVKMLGIFTLVRMAFTCRGTLRGAWGNKNICVKWWSIEALQISLFSVPKTSFNFRIERHLQYSNQSRSNRKKYHLQVLNPQIVPKCTDWNTSEEWKATCWRRYPFRIKRNKRTYFQGAALWVCGLLRSEWPELELSLWVRTLDKVVERPPAERCRQGLRERALGQGHTVIHCYYNVRATPKRSQRSLYTRDSVDPTQPVILTYKYSLVQLVSSRNTFLSQWLTTVNNVNSMNALIWLIYTSTTRDTYHNAKQINTIKYKSV